MSFVMSFTRIGRVTQIVGARGFIKGASEVSHHDQGPSTTHQHALPRTLGCLCLWTWPTLWLHSSCQVIAQQGPVKAWRPGCKTCDIAGVIVRQCLSGFALENVACCG